MLLLGAALIIADVDNADAEADADWSLREWHRINAIKLTINSNAKLIIVSYNTISPCALLPFLNCDF